VNTSFLEAAIADSRIRKTEAAGYLE
jgi:hypothetical protein